MESLFVAELGAAAMVAIRPPNGRAVVARCVLVSVLLALWIPLGPIGPSFGLALGVLIPAAFGTIDLMVIRFLPRNGMAGPARQ